MHMGSLLILSKDNTLVTLPLTNITTSLQQPLTVLPTAPGVGIGLMQAGSHHCCEFMGAATVSCPEDFVGFFPIFQFLNGFYPFF